MKRLLQSSTSPQVRTFLSLYASFSNTSVPLDTPIYLESNTYSLFYFFSQLIGTPLIYELDDDLKVIPQAGAIAPLQGRYLGDLDAIRARIEGVKNQTK
jgi:hypothetical protein